MEEIFEKILSKKELTKEELSRFQDFVEGRYDSYMSAYQSGDTEKLQKLLYEDRKLRNALSKMKENSIVESAAQYVQTHQIFEDLNEHEKSKDLSFLCKRLYAILQVLSRNLFVSTDYLRRISGLPEKRFERMIYILAEEQCIRVCEQRGEKKAFLTYDGKRLLLRLEKIVI